jgi:hypothetical protein
MFRIEIEPVEGAKFFYSRGKEWQYPEDADAVAERLWLRHGQTGEYACFSVIEQDGSIYTEWEV